MNEARSFVMNGVDAVVSVQIVGVDDDERTPHAVVGKEDQKHPIECLSLSLDLRDHLHHVYRCHGEQT